MLEIHNFYDLPFTSNKEKIARAKDILRNLIAMQINSYSRFQIINWPSTDPWGSPYSMLARLLKILLILILLVLFVNYEWIALPSPPLAIKGLWPIRSNSLQGLVALLAGNGENYAVWWIHISAVKVYYQNNHTVDCKLVFHKF